MLTQSDQAYGAGAFTAPMPRGAQSRLARCDSPRHHMPGMNGLEALRLIKHFTRRPDLMVTAAHYPPRGGLAHGALAYIPKPFTIHYINHLVASALLTIAAAQ